ncbi:hypothetical protein H5410_041794 [Solanum commersonii]|uniref:Uncharacterized protein n=1 Tax=Solanum commersonii TaxID=4109 RepID=A0A9J5XVS1_SOLCO|nr:hypothetical protein H5410_041794 [Solanum commersonii]
MVLECRPRPRCRLGACKTWYQSPEFKSPRESMKPWLCNNAYWGHGHFKVDGLCAASKGRECEGKRGIQEQEG